MHVDQGRPATHIDRESFKFLWESHDLVDGVGRPGALVPLHPRVVLRTKEPGLGFRGEGVQVPTRLDAVDVRPQSIGELLNGHHLPVKQRLYGLRIEGPLDRKRLRLDERDHALDAYLLSGRRCGLERDRPGRPTVWLYREVRARRELDFVAVCLDDRDADVSGAKVGVGKREDLLRAVSGIGDERSCGGECHGLVPREGSYGGGRLGPLPVEHEVQSFGDIEPVTVVDEVRRAVDALEWVDGKAS